MLHILFYGMLFIELYVRRYFPASLQLVISFEKCNRDIICLVQTLLMNFYIIYNY